MYSEYFLYASEYPNILRKSFLITCYSYLEHELIKECKLQRGDGIEQAKIYLKLIGLDISSSKLWNEIKNIQAIRNCIVHSDGVLTCKKDEQIRNYIKTRQDIFIKNNKIVLTADYCRYVVNTFSAFEIYIKRAL